MHQLWVIRKYKNAIVLITFKICYLIKTLYVVFMPKQVESSQTKQQEKKCSKAKTQECRGFNLNLRQTSKFLSQIFTQMS